MNREALITQLAITMQSLEELDGTRRPWHEVLPDVRDVYLREATAIADAMQDKTSKLGAMIRHEADVVANKRDYPDDGSRYGGAIHAYFGLSYASWLVIPRLSLQEMPSDWQRRFVDMLDEAYHVHGMKTPEGLYVTRRADNGKFRPVEHWNDYRRGRMEDAVAADAE